MTSDFVSVVIPTRGRPHLLLRSIKSVLNQSHKKLEAVIVIDGPDDETVGLIKKFNDPRLKIVCLDHSVGGAEARNIGFYNSVGSWIAFLDDDDEWTPDKLEKQIELACRTGADVITCRLEAICPTRTEVWPRRLPGPHALVGDYLFERTELRRGEAFIQTSTLLIKRDVFANVSFDVSLDRHHEWDWLIRAIDIHNFKLVMSPLVLSKYYYGENRPSITANIKWKASTIWVARYKDVLNSSSISSFILTIIGAAAAETRNPLVFSELLKIAWSYQPATPLHLLIYCMFWARVVFRSFADGVTRQ